jgi:hypothetical protein
LVRRKCDFVIRVHGDRIEIKGKFPQGQQAAVIHFLTHEATATGPCKIYGTWKKQRPTVWFRGRLTDPQKQRIRNFLMTGL